MIKAFLIEEEGAVTIEWVALAAGVILLAIGIIAVLNDPLEGVAAALGADIESVSDNFTLAPGG